MVIKCFVSETITNGFRILLFLLGNIKKLKCQNFERI